MIKRADSNDASAVAGLAILLWPDNQRDELEKEFGDLLISNDTAVFIQYSDEKPVGFAQCQLRRDYVEGTDTSPVGYLEGIFVLEEYRRRGYAKALLRACESWAGEMNCSEFASDCELDNRESLKFHLAMGFEEANRIICFKKKI